MSTIFLSHSSKDNALAERYKSWLTDLGHTVFLDFAEDGIKGGSDWEQTLYDKLERCQMVVALITPAWLDSKWCFAEAVQARSAGKLLLTVKAEPCDSKDVFSDIHQIDFTQGEANGRERLAAALLDVVNWDNTRPPYPGLLAFQSEEEAIFFGRDQEIRSSIEYLEALRHSTSTEGRFVLFLGASGSGKSSLIRAGVLPKLRRRPEHWLLTPIFRPGLDPIEELAMALTSAYRQVGENRDWREIREQLSQPVDPTRPEELALSGIVRDLLIQAGHPQATLLLVLDQAEELFGTARATQASQFLQLLRAALKSGGRRLLAIATMRSDFLGHFQSHPFVVDPRYPDPLSYETRTVEPMPVARFRDVIVGPANLTGLKVAPELVEQMLADTNSRDALPLLAFILRKLWDHEGIGGDNRFDLHEYHALKGISGAVQQAAEEALHAGHPGPEELQALHEAFIPTLIRVTAEGDRVRSRAFRDDIPRRADPIIADFVNRRLLVTDTDHADRQTIEVAHEALLRTWSRLDDWIESDRDKLRLFESIRRDAAEWQVGNRDPDLLIHRGDRMRDALALTREPRFGLQNDSAEADYLEACDAAEQARTLGEQAEQERRVRDAERIADEQRDRAVAQRKVVRHTIFGLVGSLALAAVAIWQFFDANAAKVEAQSAERESLDAKEEAVPWIIRATWRSGNEYTESDELIKGVRDLIRHADSIINLDKIRFLAPYDVFLSGPHESQFDWDSNQFGHYNPEFVRWASDHLIPGANDEVFRKATQSVYDKHLKTLAHAYCRAYQALHHDPEAMATLKAEYLKMLSAIDTQGPEGPDVYNYVYYGMLDEYTIAMSRFRPGLFGLYSDVAAPFWIRREIDGTSDEFIAGIHKLLDTYDPVYARKCREMTTPFTMAMIDVFPGVWLLDGNQTRNFAIFRKDGGLTIRRGRDKSEHQWRLLGPESIQLDGRSVSYSVTVTFDRSTDGLRDFLGLNGHQDIVRLNAEQPTSSFEDEVDALNVTQIVASNGTFTRTSPGVWRGPGLRSNDAEYVEMGRGYLTVVYLHDERNDIDLRIRWGSEDNAVTATKGNAAPRQIGKVLEVLRIE